MRSVPALALFLALAGCPTVDQAGEGEGDAAEGEGDAGEGEGDAAEGEGDAGEGEGDAGEGEGEGDVAHPLPGFGAISGDCDVLDAEILSAAPSTFLNSIDFGADPYDAADHDLLTPDGQRMIDTPNAGGSSLESEVFSLEVLERCEDAALLHTETEVQYDTTSTSITDYEVSINGTKVGVSVTRAVKFPFDAEYTTADAQPLIERKLTDILESSAHVVAADKWQKQILSVIAYSDAHAAVIQQVLDGIDPAVRADTIVVITVSNGDDAFLY